MILSILFFERSSVLSDFEIFQTIIALNMLIIALIALVIQIMNNKK